jgi:serine/threonine protein kinase
LSGIEEGKGNNFGEEWRRYSSPEMLKGEIKEGNEKSVVFVLGMTVNSILNKEIPLKEVDCVSAGELIVSGKRPSTSLIEKKYKEWIKILSSSVLDNPKERPSIVELKKEMDRLTPHIMNENGNEIMKNKERKEIKQKEPTVSI